MTFPKTIRIIEEVSKGCWEVSELTFVTCREVEVCDRLREVIYFVVPVSKLFKSEAEETMRKSVGGFVEVSSKSDVREGGGEGGGLPG